MDENKPRQRIPAPLGSIEPHAAMLTVPPDNQLLYKIMSIENLIRSIAGGYLHFNRVDSYNDFPGSDPNDGRQLPQDQQDNATSKFEKDPNFTAKHYYDQSRARTYACCLSLENSDYIWKNYANGSKSGKICIIFIFSKLRKMLNQILQPGNSGLEYNGNQCLQIFSVNYGIVEYVEWALHQANLERLPNPITYTYLKCEKFSEEKELRISLSALGIGKFALKDGSIMDFPPSLHVAFDFKEAIANGTIQQILSAPDCDSNFLYKELNKLRIVPIDGSEQPS